MGRFASIVLSSLLLTGLGIAQSADYHRNNIVFGVGGAIPTGTSSNYLSTAPLINIGYGYRFNRLFQADAGLEIAFGAAHANLVSEFTDVGVVPGTDHEYMVPLGGRIYIPQPLSRIEVSVGGGAAYLHYSESISSNYSAYYSVGCYTCTSRGGWGGYGLGNVNYYLDDNHTFHVGMTAQYVAASTNGLPVGVIPGTKTTDHWANVMAEFGFSF